VRPWATMRIENRSGTPTASILPIVEWAAERAGARARPLVLRFFDGPGVFAIGEANLLAVSVPAAPVESWHEELALVLARELASHVCSVAAAAHAARELVVYRAWAPDHLPGCGR